MKTKDDRTVHAVTAGGGEIVRYERAGKWWIEHADGTRSPLRLIDAVTWATEPGSVHHAGRHGGQLFDRMVNKAREEQK